MNKENFNRKNNPPIKTQINYLDTEPNFKHRLKSQIDYFEHKASISKNKYTILKLTSIVRGVLTSIFLSFSFAFQYYFVIFGVTALILSTIILACYQLEEFLNDGSTWTTYRLIIDIQFEL